MPPAEPPSAPVIEPSAFEPLTAGATPPGKSGHPVRWIVIVCAAAFVLVMAFLFTAKSVRISVRAETPAEVDIQGLAIPFGERYLLRAGDYPVGITAQGYYPLTSTLEVNTQASQQFDFVLQPLPGLIGVRSQPGGATVSVDGESLGTTPVADLKIAAGEHQLELQAERYLPVTQPLTVTGRGIAQTIEVVLAPAWATYTLTSEPADASILVDGETLGSTPAEFEILQGEHQLIVRKPGFADWLQTVTVTAGGTEDLGTIALQPATGALALTSRPSGANVTLDSEFQGQTPLTLELTPDRDHRVAVSRPGYRRYSETIRLNAAQRLDKSISLKAQLGEVAIDVSPAAATVKVDGKAIGTGSQTVTLPAFEHTVEVALPGYATVRHRVTPRPGLPQRIEVGLQTEQAAKLARLQTEITTSVGQTLLLFNPAAAGHNEFTMGASRRDPGRRANEVLHPVALRRMFYLQTTEVTNAQFRLFQADHNSGQIEGNSLNREHQPAAQVSWQQAAQYCNWLSEREALPPFYRQTKGIVTGFDPKATGYRLPTEAEWSWAARINGDTVLKFPWGDQFPPTEVVENYADNTSAYVTGRILNGYTDGHVVSAPVATFSANAKGLYDLGGNVAEWVNDVYRIPEPNSGTEIDPLGPQSGDNFVIRGASWALSKLAELRLSYRDYGAAGRDDVGFRIARYAE